MNPKKPKIILTIDLEFWHNSEFLKNYLPKNKNNLSDTVVPATEKLLKLLQQKKCTATFFVLGQLAEKYPGLIKKIIISGHEIANHGYSHLALWDMNPDSCEQEIKKSTAVLTAITGTSPKIFRAPRCSLNNSTKWLLPILQKYHYICDSSIFPAFQVMKKNAMISCQPYKISFNDVKKSDSESSILEFPIAAKNIAGLNIPVAGGIYFRLFPLFFFSLLLKSIAKKTIPVIYIHQHELDPHIPNVSAPWHKKKLLYWNKKNAFKKFEKLLDKFNFISLGQYLSQEKTSP
ncbi:DUF3473 domain-containing protein [Patescibacteria group bacterium]|nr:DUF3473 domain-containing protein [Patescibacteria group bacterium]MBU4511811.1 DUF3473 domain-containing protein [Patescibacteria group bacterium]MCG2692561.1 DUF3473 domain-containing protein [Candidatus Parcubacteria bacterium]